MFIWRLFILQFDGMEKFRKMPEYLKLVKQFNDTGVVLMQYELKIQTAWNSRNPSIRCSVMSFLSFWVSFWLWKFNLIGPANFLWKVLDISPYPPFLIGLLLSNIGWRRCFPLPPPSIFLLFEFRKGKALKP